LSDAPNQQAYPATLSGIGYASFPHRLPQDVVFGIGNPCLYESPFYGEPQTQESTQTDINSSHLVVLEIIPILMTKMEFALDILFL